MKSFRAWIARNERHLSAAVFLGSFALDNIALGRIDLPWVEALYAGYLVAAAILVALAHHFASARGEPNAQKRMWMPAFLNLAAMFFIGGLLSGCLIFYGRGAAWGISWPFILILAITFFASEFAHSRKERVSFQAVLFFTAFYLYAIFALPIAVHHLGTLEFVASGVASLVLFAGFLWLLSILGRERLQEGLYRVGIGVALVLVIVNGAYFTGILPPLPLSLNDAGIYHGLVHDAAGYEVQAETAPPAWEFWRYQTINLVPGTPLYAYSAVFAPVAFSTSITHVWQYQDPTGSWKTAATISFPINGGRDGGYRGYTTISTVTPGEWRVTIQTITGQVIGRQRFTVVEATTQPALHIENK